jgi:DNA-binding beta-propeller fold protein YncE
MFVDNGNNAKPFVIFFYLFLATLLLTHFAPFCQAVEISTYKLNTGFTPPSEEEIKDHITVPTYLYVADYGGDQILRFNAGTGAFVDHFVSASAGSLRPVSITFGPDGDMYVSSFTQGGRIMRYDGSNGASKGIFFQNTRYLDEPATLIFKGGTLWALSNDIEQVVEINVNTGLVNRYWGSSKLRYPHDMVMDHWGNLLIVHENIPNDGLRPVQVWSSRTGTFLLSMGPEDMGIASAIEFGPDGNFYVAESCGSRILRFHGRTYSYMGVFIDNVSEPWDIAFGPNGMLWVISDDKVIRFDGTTGSYIDTIIPAGSHGMSRPTALTFHSDGFFLRYSWRLWPEEAYTEEAQ